MIRSSRSHLPLVIVLICWTLVLLIPTTRQGVVRAWNNRFGVVAENDGITGWSKNADAESLLRRFPDNEKVELYAAVSKDATKWLERHPQNAVFVALALHQHAETLKFSRIEGPLSNPNYPAPPTKMRPSSSKAEWNRFMALARRGQKLEPDNTFFDWMLLYGLYETHQDALAKEVLSKAASKMTFDDHSRDAILNRLEVLRLVHGTPLSPRELYSVWTLMGISSYGKMRQCSRWVMEGVIADRRSGKHMQALNAAVELMRLSRIMRRNDYSLIGSLVGIACEVVAISSLSPPSQAAVIARKPRVGDPLSKFQSHPQMLYFYARSQNRRDITNFLDGEWVEMGKWRKLSTAIIDQPWIGNTTAQTVTITVMERLDALIVKALPAVLVLGVLFALLARRFPEDTDIDHALWRGMLGKGAWFAIGLWSWALLCDTIIALRSSDASDMMDIESQLMFNEGLLVATPSWVLWGMAATVLCLGLNLTVAWQKQQFGRRFSLRSRFSSALDAPEDGLTRFDFGWLLGLALHLTGWIVLLGGMLLLCFQLQEFRSAFGGSEDISCVFLAVGVAISLSLSIYSWRRLPHRRQALRHSFMTVAGTCAGFLVLTSVLYALTAFALLPLTIRYEGNFQNAMQRGEVAIARAKLRL